MPSASAQRGRKSALLPGRICPAVEAGMPSRGTDDAPRWRHREAGGRHPATTALLPGLPSGTSLLPLFHTPARETVSVPPGSWRGPQKAAACARFLSPGKTHVVQVPWAELADEMTREASSARHPATHVLSQAPSVKSGCVSETSVCAAVASNAARSRRREGLTGARGAGCWVTLVIDKVWPAQLFWALAGGRRGRGPSAV